MAPFCEQEFSMQAEEEMFIERNTLCAFLKYYYNHKANYVFNQLLVIIYLRVCWILIVFQKLPYLHFTTRSEIGILKK
jgi:hypothetical protein